MPRPDPLIYNAAMARPSRVLAVGSLGLVLVPLAARYGRARRHLAPVRNSGPASTDAWWVCGACRSLNPIGLGVCSSCGGPGAGSRAASTSRRLLD
jgi:hypothetical protein